VTHVTGEVSPTMGRMIMKIMQLNEQGLENQSFIVLSRENIIGWCLMKPKT
jgi:hypothetical protein